tara:strand:+ start:3524 stop:4192 length:669 start_codon:yes stop_codon:yes gene_type:complete
MKYLLLLVVAGVTLFSCKPDIKGCTDPKADNYDAYATVEDSACVYDGVLIGSGDPGGPGSVVDIPGCTDTSASNYDSTATVNDGTCIFEGCTDPEADNYDPNSTVDDGSCIDKREKFVGDWSVVNDCGILGLNDPQSISYDPAIDDVINFVPFGALGDLFGNVDGFDVVIPLQTFTLGGGFINVEIKGSGKINNDKNEIVLNLDYDAGFIGAGSCVATYTKL